MEHDSSGVQPGTGAEMEGKDSMRRKVTVVVEVEMVVAAGVGEQKVEGDRL